MRRIIGFVLVIIFTPSGFSTSTSSAQQTSTKQAETLDDILGGFEDTPPEIKKEKPPKAKSEKSAFDLTGSSTLSTAYNYSHKAPEKGATDYRGLSRLRAELLLELDTRLADDWKAFIRGKGFYDASYAINGRGEYTNDTLNTYEDEVELRDFYILGKVSSSIDIQIGRQIVAWGKSDNIRVLDILNPLDNREPGMVDIEDLRLPLFMTKLDYYFGRWDLSAIAIHEIRFDKIPAYGSDFYTYNFQPPKEDIPLDSFDNTEYALALSGVFIGWDISFHLANVFNDRPYLKRNGALITRSHSRLTMLGTAANLALGNWLLKTEIALFRGFMFFNAPGERKSRLDTLAGVEYSGFTESMISFEVANRHIYGFGQNLTLPPDLAREDEVQLAIRYNRDFMHDRVHILALVIIFGWQGEGGGVQRFSMEYDVSDSLSVTGGWVAYQSGNYAFSQNIGDNDRLFLNLKHSF